MPHENTRIITVTSGKGGVGKTNISLNMALELARSGKKTCLFDADLGLANINILLGLNPQYTLEDVIDSRCGLQDILIRNYQGIDIVPGSSGVAKMADLNPDQIELLIQTLARLDEYDFIIFDTSAGIANNIISFCLAARELILIIVPEPTSLTDAYSLLKVLSQNQYEGTVKIVVNRCKSIPSAKNLYVKFRDTVNSHLSLKLSLLGIVFDDPKVPAAIVRQEPLVSLFPKCNASTCLKHLAGKLISQEESGFAANNLGSFWSKCLQIMKGQFQASPKKRTEKTVEGEPDQEPSTPDKKVPEQSKTDTGQSVAAYSPSQIDPDYEQRSSPDKDVSQDVSQPTARKSPVQPEVSAVQDSSEQGITGLMERLVHNVASVTEELQMIRKTMENGRYHHTPEQAGFREARPIQLDFDTFLQQQGLKKSRTS